jgi:hypothetical protein
MRSEGMDDLIENLIVGLPAKVVKNQRKGRVAFSVLL